MISNDEESREIINESSEKGKETSMSKPVDPKNQTKSVYMNIHGREFYN